MNPQEYWKQKHIKYATEDWIKKPTMFSNFALKYFPESGKLLEIGAGQGQDSRFFVKKGFTVVSTDFSEEALNISKNIAKKENLNIEFLKFNLESGIPKSLKGFDVAYSHLSLHYFTLKRTESLFDEISSTLKRNGILAILLNTINDPEVKVSEKVEEGLYKTPSGLVKRFFTIELLRKLTSNRFEIIVLDNKGKTYKDSITSLVRFIGRKK